MSSPTVYLPLIEVLLVLAAVVGVIFHLKRRGPGQEGAVVVVEPAFLKFVGEQDGERERMLKTALTRFFKDEGIVQKAYLARLDIGEKHTVGLCLKAQPLPDDTYPERIAEFFIRVMGPGGYLHVLFLIDEQERDLARVCKPFYPEGPSQE